MTRPEWFAFKRLRKPGLVTLLIGLDIISVAQAQVATRGNPSAVPPPRDFAEFLIAQDLVVEGRLISVEAVTRKPIEGCGVTGIGPYRSLDVRMSVERVRFGTADDSTLVISTLGRPQFRDGLLFPGAKVIAWAFRDCHDGWRLWGRFCVVTAAGYVVGELGQEEFIRVGEAQPLRYSTLDSAMSAPQAPRHSTSTYEGASSIALVRLIRTVRRGESGYTYECDSLGWILGTGQRVPLSIDFPRVADCYPGIFPGDSLIVPVPAGFSAPRLVLTACPRSMRVKNQFATGFGVPLSFLPYALKQQVDGIHVRPYITKD